MFEKAYKISSKVIAIASGIDVDGENGVATIIRTDGKSYEVSHRKLRKGGCVFIDYKDCKLKKADNKLLMKMLRILRANKEYALPVIRTLEANTGLHHHKLPRGRYNVENDSRKVAMLCDEWKTFANECAYTDDIISFAIALTKRMHQ